MAKKKSKRQSTKDAGIKNRIVGLEQIPAAQLQPHPQNWRKHPEKQKDALRSVLDDVGWVDTIIARKTGKDQYQIIDGHLRAELEPEATVPVLLVDLDDQETLKVLASHDPLAALAVTDVEALDGLLCDIESETAELETLLAEAEVYRTSSQTEEKQADPDRSEQPPAAGDQSGKIAEQYEIVIECADEAQQTELLERFEAEGLTCRALIS